MTRSPLQDAWWRSIFEKPSTRTRVSFDVGVRQMGGQSMVLSGGEMQLGHGESIADTARVLSRYVDLIMIRTFAEDTLHELADHASVPVINGLTDRSHPCQIMADIQTFEEHRSPIAGKKVVWCGDGNNVCASFLHAAAPASLKWWSPAPKRWTQRPKSLPRRARKAVRSRSNAIRKRPSRGQTSLVANAGVMHDPETRARRHNLAVPSQ